MKLWYSFLIPAMALSLISPSSLQAADEAIEVMEDEIPTFQNAAQAQRAENLTAASFTEQDMVAARQQATEDATKEINTLAEKYADGVVDEIASDYAYREVKNLSRNHALNSVDTEDFPNLDERATYYANEYVEEKAREYALNVADGDREKYQEAYEAALTRANGSSFFNLWDTAYQEAISKALDEEAFSAYLDAYNSAYERATGGGDDWVDALQTAYNYATDRAHSAGIWREAFDHAIERATNPDFSNAYQAAYKKALEEAVTEINLGQLRKIYEMRYTYKLGWGVITKKLGLKEYHNGLGNIWKHDVGPSLDDEIIPPGPLSFEEEIAKVTQRNTKTGWGSNEGFQAKGNKNKGSKKEYGLAQVSGLAGVDVRGKSSNSRGTKGSVSSKSSSNNGKSGSVSSKSSSNNGKSGSASSKSSSNNGKSGSVSSKSSSNNGKSGSVSSKSSSNNGKKGGNSSNGNKGDKGKNK